jgi:hypothetical protein
MSANFIFAILVPEVVIKYDCRKQLETNEEVSQAITRQTTENQTMQEWTTTRWESMTDLWELMERVELLAEQVELLTERVELLTERVELLTERVHIRKTQDFLNTT